MVQAFPYIDIYNEVLDNKWISYETKNSKVRNLE